MLPSSNECYTTDTQICKIVVILSSWLTPLQEEFTRLKHDEILFGQNSSPLKQLSNARGSNPPLPSMTQLADDCTSTGYRLHRLQISRGWCHSRAICKLQPHPYPRAKTIELAAYKSRSQAKKEHQTRLSLRACCEPIRLQYG